MYVADSSGLIAGFSPSLDSGIIDFTVDFTNTSLGSELTYEWFLNGINLSTLTDEQQVFTTEGLYEMMLVATDSFGCKDTIKYEIQAIEDLGLVIPGIFTPGADGANDYFEILNIDKFPENRLQIFNRWGDLVYEAKPYNNDWDGTNQIGGVKPLGEKLVEGTYFYILYTEPAAKGINGFVEVVRD